MKLLDLFCGAGGAAMGYHRAGFEVVGVDLEPQPNYPFEFIQGDALEADAAGFDAVHASPPCQAYSAAQRLHGREHPALIDPTRALLEATGLPFVVENVAGAPLREPLTLCGSMFGLDVKRHRLFELGGFEVFPAPQCAHHLWRNRYPTHARKDKAQTSPVVHIYGTGGGAGKDLGLWQKAMEVPWMQTKAEISEAIPPAYTEHVGVYLAAALRRGRVAA